MPRIFPAPFSFLIALSLMVPSLATAGGGEDLIAAAQNEDLAAARQLLAAGVDVNFKTRYGATALFFACDKGHLEMVELLLEKGAEINVTDTFYEATPLAWSLIDHDDSPVHKQIALLLIDRGASDAAMALTFGVRRGDLELVRAALEKGEIEAAAIRSALKLAESSDQKEVAEFLRPRVPEEKPAEGVEVSAERLASYVGDYKNDDIGLGIKVFIEGEDLKLQATGQPALALDATAEDKFMAREDNGIKIDFRGRGGLVEGFQLQQGGREFIFARVESAVETAEVSEELPPLTVADRGAPIHWPRFRGADGSGNGDGQGAPTHWNAEANQGVRWKTPIPGLAHASPIVWGDRIFVASAVSDGGDESLRTGLYGDVDSVEDDSVHAWKVFALDKKSGKILWDRTASEGRPKVERHLKATHANPTPTTDGQHLVVSFASEGLFCYDLDGNLKWQKDLGVLSSGWFYNASYEWGFSSSPILHDGKVIVQIDIQKNSFIAAYDVATGKELWKTHRNEIPTWGTPAILPAGGEGGVDEVITNGTTIRGYNATTGAELWTLTPNSEVTVASPIVAEGIAYVTGGYPPARPIYAIRPGGRGDLTLPEGQTDSDHIVWSTERGGTYIPTPVAYRGVLYVLQNNGRLAAYDAKTGEQIYRQRVGKTGGYSGSPVVADGRLYFTTEEGTTYVVRTGKDYQLLATNELDEVVMTTPAISDGLLIIRGAKHIFALGAPEQTAETTATGSP